VSWDIWLEIDAGGEEPVPLFDGNNYTHNTNSMLRAALKASGYAIRLSDLNGMNAGAQWMVLEQCVQWLDSDEGKKICAPMHPPNNWGSREGLSKVLAMVAAECRRAPKATVRWSG
jgi:hypothetical protein